MVPIATGPIPVLIQYDSASKRAKKPRQVKRFANGLDRKAKNFYLEMARQGRFPVVLAADLSPVFGAGSMHTPEPKPIPQPTAELPAPASAEAAGELFANPVVNLPD